jgi:two-component system, chemotaxis family, sensor kinase CheA
VTVTGHEDEFRRLFEQEAGMRLASLAEHAMELESRSDDAELVTEMFRDAHTLKGGAAVVGFDDIAAVVHELEQLLEELRSGEREAGGALVDGVLASVDALRVMVDRAMAGRDTGGAARAVRVALAAARAGASVARPRPAAPEPVPSPAPAEPAPADPVPAAPARSAPAAEAIPVPVERLDDLVRLVGESSAGLLRIRRLLAERLGDEPELHDEYRDLAHVLAELQERTMRARMVSVATVAGPLRRSVRDLARTTGKQVRWELLGEDTVLDRHVLEHLREPLVALVRNAVDHGIEPPEERAALGKPREGVVRLRATQSGAEVVVSVEDDGRGVDVERVAARAGRRLSEADALGAIFDAGLSTAEEVTDVSGRGVGLDAVRAAVEELRGRVEVRSQPGRGTAFHISVPMTLAVLRCLLVRAGRHAYALPMHSAASALEAGENAVVAMEGGPAVMLDGEAVAMADLAGVLGLDGHEAARGPAVVLSTASGRHAFRVDELLGHRDVVVKDVGGVLPRLDLVAGASVEPDGSVMLVLDPDGVVARARRIPHAAVRPAVPPPSERRPVRSRHRILVVDDALAIRELQRSILERAGYEVATASDGAEALHVLQELPADLVLTDVEMPRLDGFALAAAIRGTDAIAATPILMLTSRDAEADRRRGVEAGADGYLVKSAFDERALLTAVRGLLGERGAGEPPAGDGT